MITDFNFEGVLGRDISGICRICLKNSGTMAIFPEIALENDFTLREKIMSFAYVEIVEDDGLPGQVCGKCLHGINSAFKLKAQCEYADFLLRQHLAINGAEDQEEEAPGNILDNSAVENVCEDAAKALATELPRLQDQSSNAKNEDSTCHKNTEKNKNYTNVFVASDEGTAGIFIDSSEPEMTAVGFNNISEANENVPLLNLNTEKLDEQPVNSINGSKSLMSKTEIRRMKRYRIREGVTEVHKCILCDKVYGFVCSLRNHLYKEHEPSGEYSCTECGKCFPQEILLNMHVETHTAEKPYCCSSCGKCFIDLQSLQAHERGHKRSRKYLCVQCGNFFSTASQHLCSASGKDREKSYECKICGKKFLRRSSLTTHSKRHGVVNRFHCKICSRPFFSKQELERHTNVHLGVRPFCCNFGECHHTFYTKGELSRHMRYHRGEKKFKCNQCEQSFFESGHLVNHKRKHTGERPYMCELCSKSFMDTSKLKRHISTHIGIPSAHAVKRMPGIQSNKN